MPKLNDLIRVLDIIAPPELAETWDKIGLQVGDKNQQVKKILLALDCTLSTMNEAVEKKCDLVLSHHPLFFNSVNNLEASSDLYKIISLSLSEKISIFSTHTNLDKAKNGINNLLADYFGFYDVEPFIADTSFSKLVFFVEPQHSLSLIKKLSMAGAGTIGNYSETSFRNNGIGSFRPNEKAKPNVGSIGVLNEVAEERVEILVHRSSLDNVIETLIKNHPYEEVAYDVYPLSNIEKSHLGLGVIGHVEKINLFDFAKTMEDKIKSKVKINKVENKEITRVALLAGSGASYINNAKNQGADVYITGDIKYHEAQLANEIDIGLINVSHFELEKLGIELFQPILSAAISKEGYSIDIISSETESDVWL